MYKSIIINNKKYTIKPYKSIIQNDKEYTIEPLLFGKYDVAIYDLKMNLLEPKKRFYSLEEAEEYFDKIIFS